MASPAQSTDNRQRPVVFETRAQPGVHRQRRRPMRVLMWITVALVGAAACCGLAEGGTAVWSVLVPKAHSNAPAPLWVNPPTVALHKQDDSPAPQQPQPQGTGGAAGLLEHSSSSTAINQQSSGTTHVESGDPDRGATTHGGSVNSGSGSTAATGGSTTSNSGRTGTTGGGSTSGSGSQARIGSTSGTTSGSTSGRSTGGGTSRGRG